MSAVHTAGESIIAGLQDALAYAQGDMERGQAHTVCVPDAIDVKAIRERQGLTQADFAKRYGFALNSIRNWEQGRRRPEGPARLLLLIIDREPEAVRRALTG
ncbi:helix-turn-helix domain-containing protein [Candidatus Entotheonella palauensis]|uniref:helix-turn-helix domain-containing protein n=1 Tax=Candidatus Entotheonella palauensis TaxID=93172 RepID=UPI000B7FB9DA|nr:helix-turn-helix domain-containing protein [Candidatus Entotheonella palauensis]